MKSLWKSSCKYNGSSIIYDGKLIEICEYIICGLGFDFLKPFWEECFEKNNIIFKITQ